MKYVLNAIQDLNKAIEKAQNNIVFAKLNIDQSLPDHLLRIQNRSIIFLESDFSQLTRFKDIFLSGDVSAAIYYASYSLDTACRDVIPPSTYQMIGGRLVNRKDMLFDSASVVDDEFKSFVNKALEFYKSGDIGAANQMEKLVSELIQPYAYKRQVTNNFKP